MCRYKLLIQDTFSSLTFADIAGLMQKRDNSIANVLGLCPFYIKFSI